MGQPVAVQVNVGRLQVVAAAAADVSGDLTRSINGRAGELAASGDGWASAAAAQSASTAWAGYVRQLSGAVADVARDLRGAADGYRAADAAAAGRVSGAGRRLPL